ncbi:hypothetical protein SAMN04487949_1031 [Halogranum gelatinilyticum]|jgi:hypothetical protein|uniref:Uncharacterized protein n=1 Tax=Halogranum gelatinilyticum TaxID=660521 RepID=A0A1G9QUF3_9EURY|nr:hypothetical protein [Halogranum gelatinilyticum]SDM14642.1 hypothetical protein SAMN04487949_1031 [Halogranum gelatinilyticum]
MPDPSRLRESTEIVVPCDALDGMRDELESEFVVTVFTANTHCRIIGSPVEIKAVNDYLARHGVFLP